jgi:hypothetical protein
MGRNPKSIFCRCARMAMTDPPGSGDLQARWDALHRQLTLVRGLDPTCTETDLHQLAQWLTDQLDELEMELASLAFAE